MGTSNIYPYTFLYTLGAERGAKIKVVNSIFKHSSFCKGAIVYRKQPYIDNSNMGWGNYTYFWMQSPYVQDNGSYIILKNSTFINLNAGFNNISALAIYGGSEVIR